jgi:NNP family nitrate/nitrite transporter-like MFS transporter
MTDAEKPKAAEQPKVVKFKCEVDKGMKSTELPLFRIGGTVQENPHMRAFWFSTCSFFIAFVGWFALAPVAIDVMYSLGQCENQLYVVGEDFTRPGFVDYVSVATREGYCVHGKLDDGSDCKEIAAEADIPACAEEGPMGPDSKTEECTFALTTKYNVDLLKEVKCVCGKGTQCKQVIANGGIASVSSAVFVRIALGTLLERHGPVNVQSFLLTFSGFWVAASALIYAPSHYYVLRFLIGTAGATFVTNQFWCSMMFAPNVVGTANATAAGWGNLGGGVTQIFIIFGLVIPMRELFGIEDDMSWRLAMLVPAFLFLACAVIMKLSCWDLPTKKKFDPAGYKLTKPSRYDYSVCLKDLKVVVMIVQYGACFGIELAMNNQLATHFRVYFQMGAGLASALASSFGLMNLFGRSLGGISSDLMYSHWGFRGRLWAQFLALFGEGLFLFAFGCVSNEYHWSVALATIVPFSVCVQVAEGTSYGMVPFMKPEQLAVVSALVGAGGNAGAVISGFAFKRDWADSLSPFKFLAVCVIVTALANPLYHWPQYGSMFSAPTQEVKKENPGDATPGRYIGKGDETPGTTLVKLASGGQKVLSKPADSARV